MGAEQQPGGGVGEDLPKAGGVLQRSAVGRVTVGTGGSDIGPPSVLQFLLRPGGRPLALTVKVPPELLLVMMNPSYGWPTLAPGSTQTPLTRVPPLLASQTSRSGGRAVTVML
jgi:hypothetical protein